MEMKRAIAKIANSGLKHFGVKLVPNEDYPLSMSSCLEKIAECGPPINTVIDIGASNGKWSAMAMRCLPNTSILAIDPLEERQSDLEKLKRTCPKFDYALCVAGEEDGRNATMNVTDDLDGSTVNGASGRPRNVPIRTVDSLVDEKKLTGPFLLKFDTHGYELSILQGSRNVLKDTHIIVMEVYNFKIAEGALRFPEMCLCLEELGFRCYDMVRPRPRIHDGAFWQMDLFFRKSDSEMFTYTQYR